MAASGSGSQSAAAPGTSGDGVSHRECAAGPSTSAATAGSPEPADPTTAQDSSVVMLPVRKRPRTTYETEPCEPSCPVPSENIPAVSMAASGSGSESPGTSGVGVSHRECAVGPSTSAATAGSPEPADPTTAQDSSAVMLPVRKRTRRTSSVYYESCTNTVGHSLQYGFPDEILFTIFSYLFEQDLCRVSQVCKRFHAVANDPGIWKRLYQSLLPHSTTPTFQIVSPEVSEHTNPWKEAIRQLYCGINVEPDCQYLRLEGENVHYFDTLQAALNYGYGRSRNNRIPPPSRRDSNGEDEDEQDADIIVPIGI